MPDNNEPKAVNAAVAAAVAGIVREVIGVVGVILVGVGGWLHYPPLGLMLAGGSLVGLAIISTISGRR
jgi:hypothetical protein